MRRKKQSTRSIVAWIFGIYASIVVFCNLPFMQKTFADLIANQLEKQIGSKVEIGSVNLGFLNNIILDDIYIEDLNHKEMLKVGRTSASINLFRLIAKGDISISSAQLYGTKANIYKKSPDSPYNFQFILDAFKSDDEESKPLHLQINSLIVRRANINYNLLYEEKKPTLDPNHLSIKNAGFNLVLKEFCPDSLNVSLKKFTAEEANSGLEIKEIAFRLIGNTTDARLTDFTFRLPKSKVEVDTLSIHYPNYSKDKTFSFDDTKLSASIAPAELRFLTPKLEQIDNTLDLTTTLSGTDHRLDIKQLSLSSEDKNIRAALTASLEDYASSSPSFDADIRTFHISDTEYLQDFAPLFTDDIQSLRPLFNLGSIDYIGSVSKNANRLYSEGMLETGAGDVNYSAELSADHLLTTNLEATDIDIQRIIEDETFGTVSMKADAVIDLAKKGAIPTGKINGVISQFGYQGYNYTNINLDALNNSSELVLKATSEDENINFTIDGTVSNIQSATKDIVASLSVKNINPHALHLTNAYAGENYSFDLTTNCSFADLHNVEGNAKLHNIVLRTASGSQSIDNLNLDAHLNGSSEQNLHLTSDFLDADITGQFHLEDIVSDFQNVIAYHLPVLVNRQATSTSTDIAYELTFRDTPILHHFITEDFSTEQPVHIAGILHSADHSMHLICNAPSISYNGNSFRNLRIDGVSTPDDLTVTVEGDNPAEASASSAKVKAVAHDNHVDSDIRLHNQAKDKLDLNLFASTDFSKSEGHLMTELNVLKSRLMINDDEWHISPANINYCNNTLECHNFKLSRGNEYLEINGRASSNPNDSLVALLNDIEVAYILDLVNFHSVEFGGKASGKAIVNNIFQRSDANATLYVKDFSLQDGVLGDASILAYWDRERDGIAVNAHIVDSYEFAPQLTSLKIPQQGVLDVNGYILPTKEELSLDLMIQDVHTDFLCGFVDGIFKDIDGSVTGTLSIVGPFADINLIGDVRANMNFTLCATNVPYYIKNESVKLRYHLFDFTDIHVRDKQNNVGILNGKMEHNNLANFRYDFNADVHNLCVYNEREFNADKYLAQVWANGDVHLYGSDGHPFTIDANVTPCKGSVFAYDSATPDALVSNSFIDFNEIPDLEADSVKGDDDSFLAFEGNAPSIPLPAFETEAKATPAVETPTYVGDLYLNVNIDLNPNCEIKLRMDNKPDGFISTFGNGTFQAKYYNKGSFQLFGNYNIQSGKYRLYLQDLVYRDLDIQDGSKVEFNGNPFDANIHLICKNEVQSAQLSNLTQTATFAGNNKVKVDCILDITGHLDNMELKFSLDLPNVSDETRQLVRSMINSDEEMNKQVIYLLAARNFYPSEYAQSDIETYGTQAVNSLLSSTLSGQINQVLSSLIGNRSKWNFGTDISTGEDWQHLDVEGSVSGSLLDDRLLINGNFGYRDNAMTNQAMFIGDFEVKYRLWKSGDFFVKAYNQANDRYFTKATLNTQGVGLNFQHDFENYTVFNWFKRILSKKDSTEVTREPNP